MGRLLGVMSFVLAICAVACSSFSSSDDPTPDGGMPDGTSAGKVSIACGSTACTGAGAVCCRNADGAIPSACRTDTCTLAAEVKVYCDDTADCPSSTVCCASFADGYHLDTASCQSSCDPKNDIRVCNAANPGECGAGLACRPIKVANENLHSMGVSEEAYGLSGCTK